MLYFTCQTRVTPLHPSIPYPSLSPHTDPSPCRPTCPLKRSSSSRSVSPPSLRSARLGRNACVNARQRRPPLANDIHVLHHDFLRSLRVALLAPRRSPRHILRKLVAGVEKNPRGAESAKHSRCEAVAGVMKSAATEVLYRTTAGLRRCR